MDAGVKIDVDLEVSSGVSLVDFAGRVDSSREERTRDESGDCLAWDLVSMWIIVEDVGDIPEAEMRLNFFLGVVRKHLPHNWHSFLFGGVSKHCNNE